ncbi:hypothetical protein BDZ85DRAFT_115426 [Elsinoe ampelina]|uniref:Uncharacterized protein n=1 Tax=Elsinoe ampelina TaxID=302913 RepID=A0A6A6GEN4_9PEZI|nr:hypothetical protein BDZ85DRAFT_115426 [Elsinoe ampelina]
MVINADRARAEGRDRLDRDDCISAMKGFSVPPVLDPEIARLCVIRGIRYHDGYATELMGHRQEFTRALNARSIMSNRVPDMEDPSKECAYCIWHPDIAREETYRALVKRYPKMKYQVGRACAVGGYTKLYDELDLLPDASIAEEARDNGVTAIFESIIDQPVIYRVLDDYFRNVNIEGPAVMCGLNCDTAVRSSLDIKQRLENLVSTKDDIDDDFGVFDDELPLYHEGFTPRTFDITEDQAIDEHGTDDTRTFDSMERLFYSPLPRHLPNLKNKEVLIDLAAAEGNIERYTRLRRPFGRGGPHARAALMRGIYHHPMFARWCSSQTEFQADQGVQNAITARYIMSNNVSRVTEDTFIPQIWYPDWAFSLTYKAVLRKAPKMKQVVARAAIVIRSQGLFIEADPDPTDRLLGMEAAMSPDPWFLQTLKNKAAAAGQEISTNAFMVATDLDSIETATRPSHGWFNFYHGNDFDLGFVNCSVVCSPDLKKHERLRNFEFQNPDMIAEMNDPLWND